MPSDPPGLFTTWLRFIQHDVWHLDQSQDRISRLARRALQGIVAVAEGFGENLVLLRASALTYYTVLSLVPLLAIVAAVIGSIGMGNLLPRMLEPIARVSPEMARSILGFVEQFDFASLGTLGAALLFLTTITGISSIERALNAIWGLDHDRPWDRRVPDYLAVVVIAPLLLGVALSLSTILSNDALVRTLLEYPSFSRLYQAGLYVAPVLFYWAGFSFLYWFMPNTHVRVQSAVLGGAIAALAFVILNQVYVSFQIGVARANALFGGVAAFPITVVWVHFSWTLVLVGAECAYVHQNLAQLRRTRVGQQPRPAAHEAIGVAVATQIARAFLERGEAVTIEDLSKSLEVDERPIRSVLHDLEHAEIVVPRGDPRVSAYQPGRSPGRVTLSALLTALRGTREPYASLGDLRPRVLTLLHEMDRKAEGALGGHTLADLATSPIQGEPPAPPDPPRGSLLENS